MLLQGTAGEPLTPILSFKFLSPVRLKRNPVLVLSFFSLCVCWLERVHG